MPGGPVFPIPEHAPGDRVMADDWNRLVAAVNTQQKASLGPGMAGESTPGRASLAGVAPNAKSVPVFQALPDPGSSTGIIVGPERDYSDYGLVDRITVVEGEDQRYHAIDLSAASETVTATAAGYTYYEVRRDLGGTWSAHLKWSATWPPTGQSMDNLYWCVATNEWESGRVSRVHQVGVGNPILWQRQTLADFAPVYARDLSTPSVIVTAGRVEVGGSRAAVSQQTYPLGTGAYVWVEWTYTVASRAYAVTGTLQSGASNPDWRTFSAGVITYKALLGVISGGQYLLRHAGIVRGPELFDPTLYPNWSTSGNWFLLATDGVLEWIEAGECS